MLPALCSLSTDWQRPGAAPSRNGLEPGEVESEVLGLVDRALEAAAREDVGEVDDGAGGGVTGMPWMLVRASGPIAHWCATIPGGRLRATTVTSMKAARGPIRQSSAALR